MPLNENNIIPGLKQIYHKESFFLQPYSHCHDEGNIFELQLRSSLHCLSLRKQSLLFLNKKKKFLLNIELHHTHYNATDT